MGKTGETIVCKICGKEKYYPAWHIKKGASYCSKACNLIALKGNKRWDHPNARKNWFRNAEPSGRAIIIFRNCLSCKKRLKTTLSERKKYCGRICYGKDKKGKTPSHIKLIFINCLICKNKFRTSAGLIKAGTNKFCSKKCYDTYQTGKPTGRAGIPLLHLRGENASHWQGGKTKEVQRIRGSIEYKLWRGFVFRRDNYTCQGCEKRGGFLHANHIKPFSTYPELRFEVSNGETLCIECHYEKTFNRRIKEDSGWGFAKRNSFRNGGMP